MSLATDPNTLPLPELYVRISETGLVRRLLELARDEDMGPERLDVTSLATHGEDRLVEARLVFREPGVASGLAALVEMIEVFGGQIQLEPGASDGSSLSAGAVGCTLKGSAQAILTLERTALNLVGRLSGVASRTRRFVDAIATAAPDSEVRLLDTRKTTPGLRVLEKYAVRCGGGYCHRLGLYDAVLIKDNHLAGLSPQAVGRFVEDAADRAKRASREPLHFFEVEVDTLEQLDAILALPPGTVDIVLLDNMSNATLREAVARRDSGCPSVLLEASGGVRLETIGEIARTGADRISVGGLTHQAVSLDVALEFQA